MKKLLTLLLSSALSSMVLAQSADVAQNISAADIGDWNGAADFEFSFDTATVQNTISEYRAMIVKQSKASTFTVDSAQAVIMANYMAYTSPLANNVIETLTASSTDTDGDVVVVGVAYRVFVLSVADTAVVATDSLAQAASSITLVDPTLFTIPFSEDFESGVFPPTEWQAIDDDGDGFNWTTATGNFSTIGDFSATSASWNSGAGALTPDNYFISPAISMVGLTGSNYELGWYVYAQDQSWVSEFYEVYVSTTGSTQGDFTVLGTSIFSETLTTSNDFMKRSADVTAFIGDTIWIAFRHYNSTDWFHINLDDIVIQEKPGFDLTLTNTSTGLSYAEVPFSQLSSGIVFSGEVTNNGASAATNVTLSVDINSGLASDAGTLANLNSNATQTITTANGYTPTSSGSYQFDFEVTMDSADFNTADNVAQLTMEVTDTVFARGIGGNFALGGALATGTDNEYGMMYEMYVADTITSITVDLINGDMSGVIKMNVYEYDAATNLPGVEIATTGVQSMPQDMITDEVYTLTLALTAPTPVLEGKYIVSVVEETGATPVGIMIDGTSIFENNTAFTTSSLSGAWLANESFWTGDFYFPIKMNIGKTPFIPPVDGVTHKVEDRFVMYPNPAENVVNLSNVANFELIEVVDIAGKTVASASNSGAASLSIDVAHLADGMYVVRATSENGSFSQKLTIK